MMGSISVSSSVAQMISDPVGRSASLIISVINKQCFILKWLLQDSKFVLTATSHTCLFSHLSLTCFCFCYNYPLNVIQNNLDQIFMRVAEHGYYDTNYHCFVETKKPPLTYLKLRKLFLLKQALSNTVKASNHLPQLPVCYYS